MAITSDNLMEGAVACIERSLKILPDDMVEAIREAGQRESRPQARRALEVILQNAERAALDGFPLCQDTGIPGFLVELGLGAGIDFDIWSVLRSASERVTRDFPLIAHAVHPVSRNNPGTNVGPDTPVVHVVPVPGSDRVVLTAKPFSAIEARCAMRAFDVTADLKEMDRFLLEAVCEAGDVCPPLTVGIGLGSSLDRVGYLALKASIRPVGSANPFPEIAALEKRWLRMMNELGMGAMNLGGDITALACHVEVGMTHSVHTLMAVRPECWCNRRATVVVTPDGAVQIPQESP